MTILETLGAIPAYDQNCNCSGKGSSVHKVQSLAQLTETFALFTKIIERNDLIYFTSLTVSWEHM